MAEDKKKARILIVEDEDSVRAAFARILETYGYDTSTAKDAEEGLAAFDQGGFDLVFTDLSLPGMSGWDLARLIKEINPKTPVVILSGWEVGGEQRGRVNVDRTLMKPIKVKEILQAINELLAGC